MPGLRKVRKTVRSQCRQNHRIRLVYRLYTATWHRKDDLNLYEALDDILVSNGILKDDDRKTIRSRDGSRVLYDKENPRAEIYIYPYSEEDDHEIRD